MANATFHVKVFILKLKTRLIDLLEKVFLQVLIVAKKRNKTWQEVVAMNKNRNRVYREFQIKFKKFDPIWLREHRLYFGQFDRGFGDDAFHSYWLSLFKQYKPIRLLEIGVYRGQTISLWSLIARYLGIPAYILGISPLDDSGDSVSSYPKIDYEKDIKINFQKFQLSDPNLLKGLSSDHDEFIKNGNWDLIYIDGDHDYLNVKNDLSLALTGLKIGGLLVLDDSSLYTNFRPCFSNTFRGHPGPSKLFSELNTGDWEFILGIGHNNVLIKRSQS